MVKIGRWKKVYLQNASTFYAKYKSVKRSLLPDNMTIKRTCKRRKRKKKETDSKFGDFREY